MTNAASEESSSAQPKKNKQKYNHYPFHAPRVWHGMKLGTWLKFLWQHRFAVAISKLHIAIPVTLVALGNSLLSYVEALLYWGKFGADSPPLKPPVIILGHWRSGTTLLHELIVTDSQFGYPDTFDCFLPEHFLITKWLTPLMGFLLPKKRPTDNMLMGWDLPQEDEFALMDLGAGSPYSMLGFPNRDPQEDRFLDFRGVSEKELSRWKRTLLWFLKRVAYRNQKTLVLKSPPHTARLSVLLEMFPEAKIIHIVRDPLALFPSTVRLWKSLTQVQGLQIPNDHFDKKVDQIVIEQFCRMYERFEADRRLVHPDRFFELRYEDLVADPAKMIETIYAKLGLGNTNEVGPRIQKFMESQKNYKTNKHEISPEMRAMIEELWGPYVRRYGYLQEGQMTDTTPSWQTTT